MEAFALYLGKSALWISGFALIYFLFLRNERFFTLKRIYLMTGIIASLLFPLISFNYTVEVPAVQEAVSDMNLISSLPERAPDVQQAVTDGSNRPDIRMIILIVYLSGLLFLLVRMLKQAGLMLKKIRMSKIEDIGYARLVRTPEFSMSFSFFNYIFINPSMNNSQMEPVMKHELVHVRQKHWLDLIMAETFCLFQWMNPFTWMYSRYIRQNHEYIADQAVLQDSADPAFYKAILLNQMFDSQVICLSNSFNYSLNKTRFEMMKTIISSPWRKLKILWVIPFIAIVFYAFATPEYSYIDTEKRDEGPLTIYESPIIIKQESATAQIQSEITEEVKSPGDGTISDRGSYKNNSNEPNRADNAPPQEKKVIVNDPGSPTQQKPEPIVVIDGEVSELKMRDVGKHLGYNMGPTKMIRGQEAIDKYGEKGANGVIEVTTRKKALEMGLKSPLPRLAPDDYPTFQGKPHAEFRKWVLDQLKYPEEATNKKIEGWVSVNFQVNLDGTVTNAQPNFKDDPILTSALINVVKSSPVWDPPKNPDVDDPFRTGFTVRFILPDQISREDPPFVVVEEMPLYPGGAEALLGFINKNLNYPPEARKDSIQGRVILRFIVTAEGNTEDISVLKGVHPLLDAEAVRVAGMLTGWKPGRQGGKPVHVWYMAPVNFVLSDGIKPSNP